MSDEIRKQFQYRFPIPSGLYWEDNKYVTHYHGQDYTRAKRNYNKMYQVYKSRNPELKELTEKLWDSDQLVDMLNHEKEELQAENKKLQEDLKIVYESIIAKDYIAAIEILSEVLNEGRRG